MELAAPDLHEGNTVEVIILMPEAAERAGPQIPCGPSTISEFLRSLPPSSTPLLYGTWTEYEQHMRQARGSWDR